MVAYRLLTQFENVFRNGPYRHRNSTLGDSIAVQLYEDLYQVSRSKAYVSRVDSNLSVVNGQNKRQGVKARRGDGAFGEIVPHEPALSEPSFAVKRGPIATIEIGVEVKILSKAMVKQIDRVVSDLTGQVRHFRSRGGSAITLGIVGINHAPYSISWEGDREWRTDGKKHKHPIQEAAEAERRLLSLAAPAFDEFLILRFVASNDVNLAYDFKWLDEIQSSRDYGAALARISAVYQTKFS